MKVLTFQTPDAIKKALWVAQGFKFKNGYAFATAKNRYTLRK
jgi:hypothetical protein